MASFTPVSFPPFHLDSSGQLRREEEERFLRPKTLAVLHYLVQHAGQVVSKDELLAAVWPEVIVSEAVLAVCVNELRQALEDDPRQPRFIATVHRRGYRFLPAVTIPPVVSSQLSVVRSDKAELKPQVLTTGHWPLTTPFVGREAELAQLQQWWDLARGGQRQIVFVSGEPGIGKTTLIDRFLARLSHEHEHAHELWSGRGQCVEQYGEGEAYLPVLEALGQLCRGLEGRQVQEVLHRHAPTWLLQMPGLVETAELHTLQVRTAGATRERMLREMAEALEALTVARGLVLVCEDVHVSDRSTLDLIAYLAQRRGPAHLMILSTYRSAEVIVRTHPLKGIVQELQGRQQCQYLPVELLSERAVGEYLTVRFAPQPVPPAFAAQVYDRTEGNALSMVTLVDYLLGHGLLRQEQGEWQWPGSLQGIGVPEGVRQLIERQLEHLSEDEQRVLEVASVAGMEFSAAVVSAGLEIELLRGEERCEAMARRTLLLQPSGMEEWPDGTGATQYRFRHAVYQEVVYDRLTASRQRALHQRLGERLEAAYGQQAGELAAILAMHFERGQDYLRAVHYRQQAGENALRRSAHQEAISHLTQGLELLNTLPDTGERAQQELTLQTILGPVLLATKGMSAPEAERAYVRAQELCQRVREALRLFPVLWGLWQIYLARGEYETAQESAEQLLTLARSAQDSALLLEAHDALGTTLTLRGAFAPAREHFEQAIALYDPQHHHPLASLYGGEDPGVICLAFAALPLWMLGYPDQALRRSHEALTLARELSHPYSLAQALGFTAWLHQYRREGQAARGQAEAAIALSTEQGFSWWLALGTVMRGWALAEQGRVAEEGIPLMRQGLAAHLTIGAKTIRPYLLALLAEAYGKAGEAEEGLALLAEALAAVEKTGERCYEAELYRLKGELTLQQQSKVQSLKSKVPSTQHPAPRTHAKAEAEACFLKAIEVARQQQAKSLELRAAMSLVRLRQRQVTDHATRHAQHVSRLTLVEAHKMLSEIYDWFTEGFDTRDLQEAKALLNALS